MLKLKLQPHVDTLWWKFQVYEGEVTELSPVETENPVGGFTKTVSHVVIGMKTAKGTKQLKLDPSIYEALQKERVEVGERKFE